MRRHTPQSKNDFQSFYGRTVLYGSFLLVLYPLQQENRDVGDNRDKGADVAEIRLHHIEDAVVNGGDGQQRKGAAVKQLPLFSDEADAETH